MRKEDEPTTEQQDVSHLVDGKGDELIEVSDDSGHTHPVAETEPTQIESQCRTHLHVNPCCHVLDCESGFTGATLEGSGLDRDESLDRHLCPCDGIPDGFQQWIEIVYIACSTAGET